MTSVDILGLYVTSLKIKLRTIDSSDFLLSRGMTAPKPFYINKFLVPKGTSICERGRLKLQAFA